MSLCLSSRALSALLLWLLLQCAALAQEPVLQVIEHVDFLYWNSTQPPPPDVAWRRMTLPFNTREDTASTAVDDFDSPYVWFRFALEQPPVPGRYSLYFWRFNMALGVFMNGVEIGSTSTRQGRTTLSWNHPLLVDIQQPVWRPGSNEVLVRLTRSGWGGNFAPALFGDSASLQDLWSERMFRQVEINEILLAFGLGLSFVSFVLWAIRARDTVYLWFSGMCLSWSGVTLHMVALHIPIPYEHWLSAIHTAIDLSIFCMYGFIGRLVDGVKKPSRERLVAAWTAAAAITHFVVPPEYFWATAYSLHLIGTLALALIVFRVAIIALREHRLQAIIISTAILLQILLFSHNVYLMFFANSARWEGNIFYAHFGIPMLFLIFIGTLLMRFTSALSMAETLNRELESKVESSRLLIERSFAERRALEMRQAAEQERLKIYRDLHDDVGSRLLSIVHADRESKLGHMARLALESLRQAVSKANNPDQALAGFLSDIQEETELRLRGSGHDVQWTQAAEIPALIIPSALAFNLNRILKEVVSNIIRHAAAEHVEIQSTLQPPSWQIVIQDNGRGFDRHDVRGNGLHNIESRAAEIGAQVRWEEARGGGTRFTVTLPLSLLQAAPDAA
jgi:signal transduction histidine kinase